jgi:hypothetical protein
LVSFAAATAGVDVVVYVFVVVTVLVTSHICHVLYYRLCTSRFHHTLR